MTSQFEDFVLQFLDRLVLITTQITTQITLTCFVALQEKLFFFRLHWYVYKCMYKTGAVSIFRTVVHGTSNSKC